MTTIYKYPLQPGRTVLEMPEGAKTLTAQMQGPDLCLWMLVEPHKPVVLRMFDVYGTGHGMPSDPGTYVATVQMDGGSLVWHVFDWSPAA